MTMKSFYLLSIVSFVLFRNWSAGYVVPEQEDQPLDFGGESKSNLQTNETQTCPKRMSLYPLDENSTKFVCDCSFLVDLYYPEDDTCYDAYLRGPCPPGHYLILPEGENVAKCEKNPCVKDHLVLYDGKCGTLHGDSSCHNVGTIVVDPTNFKLKCVFSKNWNIFTAPAKACPPGSRRTTLSECKRVF